VLNVRRPVRRLSLYRCANPSTTRDSEKLREPVKTAFRTTDWQKVG